MKTFPIQHARAFRCKPLFAVMPEEISRPMQIFLDEYPGLIAKYGTGAEADRQTSKEVEELVKASEAAFNLYFGIDGTTISIQG